MGPRVAAPAPLARKLTCKQDTLQWLSRRRPRHLRQFFDRDRELAELDSVVDDALAGSRRWVALLGHRKIGKTSLLMELLRRRGGELVTPYVDCWEVRAN